jgi:hypothetical protein
MMGRSPDVRRRTTRRRAGALVGALALPWWAANADEGGVAFWTSGSDSSLAAVPATPGWSLPTQLYNYEGSAGVNQALQHGTSVDIGFDSRLVVLYVAPTWAPDTKWLGGQPSLALQSGVGWNSSSAAISLSTTDATERLNRSDSIAGGVDLYPTVQLAWTHGDDNWMAYGTGDVPTGAYNSSRLSNIGLGHAAIDLGGAYTYLNSKSGFESSAVVGFTYNAVNSSTHIRSGVDSHFDWDVSRYLSSRFQLGIAGYAYYQLGADSGSGNRVGAFRSRVASVGPELAYAFPAGGLQWYVNLRGYREFWARNRTEGRAVFLTLNVPIASAKK